MLYIYEINLSSDINQVQAILPQGNFVYSMLSVLNRHYLSLKKIIP